MEYKEAKQAVRDVQGTLEALSFRITDPELKAMASRAVDKLTEALAAIHLHDDRRGRG